MDGDDTAANDLHMMCTDGTSQTMLSGGGTSWGDWGNWHYCPSGTWICGLSVRVEKYQGGGDDTSRHDRICVLYS